jgi:hypothetical protein
VGLLQKAFQFGYRNFTELSSPRFAPLHERADFQKLLAEMKKSTGAK